MPHTKKIFFFFFFFFPYLAYGNVGGGSILYQRWMERKVCLFLQQRLPGRDVESRACRAAGRMMAHCRDQDGYRGEKTTARDGLGGGPEPFSVHCST